MRLASQILLLSLFFLLAVSQRSIAAIITGNEITYTVQGHDSLLLISAKLGVDPETIIRENSLNHSAQIAPGRVLKLNTRKISPKAIGNGIIIDITGRMLYFFKAGRLEMSFPVGLGKTAWQGLNRWHTPSGSFTITGKDRNPVWYVPESIQREMLAENKPMLTTVSPGQGNPLGAYVLYTSLKGIGIHETIWPTTVYQYRSHGCIRVLRNNIAHLFDAIELGTAGELVYKPVKIAVADEGRIYLQADPDAYGKNATAADPLPNVVNQCRKMGVAGKVDWARVKNVLRARTGNAEDITRASAKY